MALVCHMEKYKQNDCGGIQTEDNRESDAINKKNPNLDLTKTHLNKHYSYELDCGRLVETRRSRLVDLVKGHKQRINILKSLDNKPKLRKDAVVCCSFIIGADSDYLNTLSYEEQIKYFKTAVQFFEKNEKFGTVMEYSMHFDEGTPHMHLRILPEHEVGFLSAKKMFTPKTLSEIQRKLPLWMHEHGFEVEAGKKGSPAKHLNEAEYRIKCANDRVQELESQIERLLSHSEVFEKGLKASYEVEELLEEVKNIAEFLKNEPLLQRHMEMDSKNRTLRSEIEKADRIYKEYQQSKSADGVNKKGIKPKIGTTPKKKKSDSAGGNNGEH